MNARARYTVRQINTSTFAIRRGKGYVIVIWDGRAAQYHVPAGAAGTYLTRKREDAFQYAADWGAIRRREDGRPARLRDIKGQH